MHYLKLTIIFFCIILKIFAKSNEDGSIDVLQIRKEIETRIPEVQNLLDGPKYLNIMQKVVDEIQNRKELQNNTKNLFELEPENVSFGAKFTCKVTKSNQVPTSVHQLRPSDIKVIGTIGDSISAGTGINAKSVAELITQNRGHAFTGGGVELLRDHATVPNILKEFNPTLTGYSTGFGGPDSRNAVFNVAQIGDRAEHILGQAKKMVDRMKSSSDVNFNADWKLINIFIGGNDICDYCKFPSRFTPDKFKSHVEETLSYLEANVPRAFVNLIEVLDASAIGVLKDQSPICKLLLQTALCKCGTTQPINEVRNYALQLQRVTQEIMADPDRYNKRRDDFTVVLQPFLRNTKPPRTPQGNPDLRYFAPDCFHLSKLGHREAGIALWRNMLQPVGGKDTEWSLGSSTVDCPTDDLPYLATHRNRNRS